MSLFIEVFFIPCFAKDLELEKEFWGKNLICIIYELIISIDYFHKSIAFENFEAQGALWAMANKKEPVKWPRGQGTERPVSMRQSSEMEQWRGYSGVYRLE